MIWIFRRPGGSQTRKLVCPHPYLETQGEPFSPKSLVTTSNPIPMSECRNLTMDGICIKAEKQPFQRGNKWKPKPKTYPKGFNDVFSSLRGSKLSDKDMTTDGSLHCHSTNLRPHTLRFHFGASPVRSQIFVENWMKALSKPFAVWLGCQIKQFHRCNTFSVWPMTLDGLMNECCLNHPIHSCYFVWTGSWFCRDAWRTLAVTPVVFIFEEPKVEERESSGFCVCVCVFTFYKCFANT